MGYSRPEPALRLWLAKAGKLDNDSVYSKNFRIEFHDLIRGSDVGWRLRHDLRCRSPVDYHDLNGSPVYFMNANTEI